MIADNPLLLLGFLVALTSVLFGSMVVYQMIKTRIEDYRTRKQADLQRLVDYRVAKALKDREASS